MTDVGQFPSRRAEGPRRAAIVVLVIATMALVATGAPPPTLESRVIGEVVLGPGESVERRLHVSLAPDAGEPTGGHVSVALQAANGLSTSGGGATVRLVEGSDAAGVFTPAYDIPIDRCQAGCELDYRIGISAGPDALPGSIVRIQVDVEVQFSSYGGLDPGDLVVDLEGRATGPVAPLWSLLAGILALVAGIAWGPAVDRAMAMRRRRWPAVALAAFPIGFIAWWSVQRLGALLAFGAFRDPELLGSAVTSMVDPWSMGLAAILAWGLRRGFRAWSADGGWLLGLAAVATAGLGGLWLAWATTLWAIVQPVALGVLFALFGGLAGIVIGQAWRTDPRAFHDRVPGGLAVVSHGIVIFGFLFLVEAAFYDPFGNPAAALLLIPAILVAAAFRRWLRGRQGWLIAFDLVIAVVGAFGTWTLLSLGASFASGPPSLEIGVVAVGLALGAAIVAFISSLHRMSPARPVPPPEAAADPATT